MQIIIPQEELYSRIQLFQKKMREKEIDAVLIAERTDLYYFSGTGQQAFLYMQPEGEPLLLVKKDFERARMESNLRKFDSIRARSKSFLTSRRGSPSGCI